MENEKFKNLIKQAQGERSQNEYAMHCKVDSATITRAIRGERKLKPATIKKLASRAYNGVTYEMLMEAAGYLHFEIVSEQIKESDAEKLGVAIKEALVKAGKLGPDDEIPDELFNRIIRIVDGVITL